MFLSALQHRNNTLFAVLRFSQWREHSNLLGCDDIDWYIGTNFTFMWPWIVTNFLIIKPTRCTNFSNLFWNESLRVSDSSSVHHQELFTVHSAMVYVIQVCRQLSSSSRIRMEHRTDCSKAVYKPVWHIPLLSFQWITPDDEQRNCPKHVEFHSKINLRNECI
jgi:hypothetical protein